MRMSSYAFLVSGVWEATGAVAKTEIGGLRTFSGTSSWNGFSHSFKYFAILDFVTF